VLLNYKQNDKRQNKITKITKWPWAPVDLWRYTEAECELQWWWLNSQVACQTSELLLNISRHRNIHLPRTLWNVEIWCADGCGRTQLSSSI